MRVKNVDTSSHSFSVSQFLEKKTLYYDKIDYDVISSAWKELAPKVELPFVIHIIGTNGKGSTGRFLAHYLHKIGKDVLHYSSPHILKFNERIWINGKDVSDEELEKAHLILQDTLSDETSSKLTYFEYTTLLALLLGNGRDIIVLEAGLGGEFDATNVVDNDLTLFTAVDLDHQEFLGNTVKEIAATKMRSCDKAMIVGKQLHDLKVKDSKAYLDAKPIELKKELKIYEISDFELPENVNIDIPSYLLENLKLAMAALRYLNIEIDTALFEDVKLFGRAQRLNDRIMVDVGHNPLAAKALKETVEPNRVVLVYNSYKDKDYKRVLSILEPIVKEVQVIEIKDQRMVQKDDLVSVCNNFDLKVNDYKNIKESEDYLVFGSFMVVEEFLKRYGVNR